MLLFSWTSMPSPSHPYPRRRMSNVLPWIGLGVTIVLYLAVVFFPADVEAKAKAWIRKAGVNGWGWGC